MCGAWKLTSVLICVCRSFHVTHLTGGCCRDVSSHLRVLFSCKTNLSPFRVSPRYTKGGSARRPPRVAPRIEPRQRRCRALPRRTNAFRFTDFATQATRPLLLHVMKWWIKSQALMSKLTNWGRWGTLNFTCGFYFTPDHVLWFKGIERLQLVFSMHFRVQIIRPSSQKTCRGLWTIDVISASYRIFSSTLTSNNARQANSTNWHISTPHSAEESRSGKNLW